jgi:ABC-type histidine transport system ATPase subunit
MIFLLSCTEIKKRTQSHEWGYGILNAGSSGSILNMVLTNMTGDGLYVGSINIAKKPYHGSTIIDSCEISYCRRNGITGCSSEGLTIKNTKIHHIGTYGEVMVLILRQVLTLNMRMGLVIVGM